MLLLCVIAYLVCEGKGINQDIASLLANLEESIPTACPSGQEIKRPDAPDVPENFQPWATDYPGYNATKWDEVCRFEDCDPEISNPDFHPKFNEKDGNVNRRRAGATKKCGSYLIQHGLPLNPAGRTGLTGRGMLPRYGPNHLVAVVFIWKTKGNLSLLKRSSNSTYRESLFTGFVDDPDKYPLPHQLYTTVNESLMHEYKDYKKVKKIIKKAKQNIVKLLAGSIPSELETDNAWTELSFFAIPCQKTKLLCSRGLSLLERERGLDWYVVDVKNNSVNRMFIDETAISTINHRNYSIYENECMKKSFKLVMLNLALRGVLSLSAAAAVMFSVLGMLIGLLVGAVIGACMLPASLFMLAHRCLNEMDI
uniref:Uncharacterized protein n=2 Tax=Trichuris muris TaxID=70415 RepID=A0A5S6QK49_TRIMR